MMNIYAQLKHIPNNFSENSHENDACNDPINPAQVTDQ